MAAFSRWQLAAALLEYDNDPDNPYAPNRNAHDSAIFAPIRKANANIHDLKLPPPQSPNLLGVKLPSESGLTSDAGDTRRRSKASVDMLHNPFGGDEEEEEGEEEDLEVDLASWGLDSLMPEEKPSKRSKGAKGKAKSDTMANTVGVGRRPGADRPAHSRTMSMPLAEFGEGGAFLDANQRRNTISDPIDLGEMGVLGRPSERQRFSSHPLIEHLPVSPPLHSTSSLGQRRDTVPFPSSPPMSGQSDGRDSRPASRLNLLSEEEPNPFAIPPPPPSRASRFDPKYTAHMRTLSNATRLSVGPQSAYNGEDQITYSQRAPSRASLLDAQPMRDRRLSAASFGTRDMLDDDFHSAYGREDYLRERRYSRLELMRPKVLVMPSPLQMQTTTPQPAPKVTRTKEGFLDSSDGKPLPPGARASRASTLGPLSVPVAANSFTPNPRLSLTASQLLFRNTLLVDGQKDVSYNDIDGELKRATEDGEQVEFQIPEEPEKSEMVVSVEPNLAEEAKRSRPPGKLYGRSLIDNLEARKQEIRSKQRVFTGDQRPSMMARTPLNRTSTLIDPSTLPRRPTMPSREPSSQTDTALVRRGSRSSKPLLAIGNDGQILETGKSHESRMAQTRSVFGVDKLWEMEMAKLKEIEAEEQREAEARKQREEEEESKKAKKKKKKGKKGDGLSPVPSSPAGSSSISPRPQSVSPQTQAPPSLSLPDIPTVTSRKRTAPVLDDDESDNESSASEAPNQNAALQEGLADQWVSDDERKPVPSSNNVTNHPRINPPAEDDSDEDVPLSVALRRATQKLGSSRSQPDDDDSDEDRPLSMMLLSKPSLASFNIPSSSLSDEPKKSQEEEKASDADADDDDDDEDNVPLGVRASRLPAGTSQLSGLSVHSATGENEDDDRPLSMHPAQIRKSQYQMLAHVQQQQQQLMAQAQMANSMMLQHQSMMFMMPPAAPIVSQPAPPIQDINKFSSVDRWRHDVAVEQN